MQLCLVKDLSTVDIPNTCNLPQPWHMRFRYLHAHMHIHASEPTTNASTDTIATTSTTHITAPMRVAAPAAGGGEATGVCPMLGWQRCQCWWWGWAALAPSRDLLVCSALRAVMVVLAAVPVQVPAACMSSLVAAVVPARVVCVQRG